MSDIRTLITDHIRTIAEAKRLGATIPADHDRLVGNWNALVAHELRAVDKLSHIATQGDLTKDDFDAPYREALVDYNANLDSRAQYGVTNTVATHLYPAMLEAYGTVAVANYQDAAKAYNEAAGRLADALNKCDPDADTAEVLAQSKAAQSAWLSIDMLTAEVDQAARAVQFMARLAGVESAEDDATAISLLTDTTGAHRRRVWDGWSAVGRGGKWRALIDAGAKLKANDLDKLEPYAQPEPMQVEHVTTLSANKVTTTRTTTYVDPEDEKARPSARARARA